MAADYTTIHPFFRTGRKQSQFKSFVRQTNETIADVQQQAKAWIEEQGDNIDIIGHAWSCRGSTDPEKKGPSAYENVLTITYIDKTASDDTGEGGGEEDGDDEGDDDNPDNPDDPDDPKDPNNPDGPEEPEEPEDKIDSPEALEDAITSAESGDTITLDSPITLTKTLKVTNNVTIDLNNQNLSFGGKFNITAAAGSDLKITGSGTISNNETYPVLVNGGNLTIEGDVKIESSAAAAVVASAGTLNVAGGKITNPSGYGIQGQKASTINITGGTIEAGDYGVKNIGGGSITVENASITGKNGGIYVSGDNSNITVNSGTIDGTSTFGIVMFDTSNLTVEGGTFKGAAGVTINGTATQKNASITVNGGKFEGTNCGIYLPNGTLTVKKADIEGPIGIMVRGGTLNMEGGNVTGTKASTEKVSTGDAGYEVPAAAIAIDKNSGYNGGNVNVNITGGTITAHSAEDKAISYTENGNPVESTNENITFDGASITGTTPSKGE